jgi:hypothetical protein
MNETPQRMAELSEETREFLNDLSREDIATLKTGLPLIRMIVGFGKVTKWLAITDARPGRRLRPVMGIACKNRGMVSACGLGLC